MNSTWCFIRRLHGHYSTGIPLNAANQRPTDREVLLNSHVGANISHKDKPLQIAVYPPSLARGTVLGAWKLGSPIMDCLSLNIDDHTCPVAESRMKA